MQQVQQVVVDPDAMALLDDYIGEEKAKLAKQDSSKKTLLRARDITKRKFVSDLIRSALNPHKKSSSK